MKFTAQLTAEDVLEAMKVHRHLRPVYRRIIYGLAVVYAGAAVFAVYKIIALGEWDADIIPALVTMALLAFFFRRAYSRQMAKIYRQQKNLQDAYTIEFTEEGYFMESPTGTTRMRWPDLHGWRAGEKFLLLYQSEALFNLLPFRALDQPQDKEKLLHLIQSKRGDPLP